MPSVTLTATSAGLSVSTVSHQQGTTKFYYLACSLCITKNMLLLLSSPGESKNEY